MSAKKSSFLSTKIEKLPPKPGIYFFKNRDNKVIYIGKARSIKSRVKSYFLPSKDPKINSIVSETEDVDCILTDSEREAAFLENSFIRENQPKYNIRLKDDKSFPFLKMSMEDKFPGIYLVRKVEADSSRYFGPFSPANQARKTIHLITKYFGIRSCKEPVPGKRKRPCLEFDLELCSAPCVEYISDKEYRKDVRDSLLFLEGRVDSLLKVLTKRMKEAAEDQEFERAAHWRDFILTMEQIKNKPKLVSIESNNEDIFGFSRDQEYASLFAFIMREGKVSASESIISKEKKSRSDEDILLEQLDSFYKGREDIPDYIKLPFPLSEQDNFRNRLSVGKRKKIKMLIPKRGKGKRLIELANQNALSTLENRSREALPLSELQDILGLKALPVRIEGFDVSNISGQQSVGSMVVFINSMPQKKDYRLYNIKTVQGPDDVASLHEIIQRRYTKMLREHGTGPNLILVDGGKGQLNAAQKALSELEIRDIPVISLAKKEDLIFSPTHKRGLKLDDSSPALRLVQNVRDEAHRFALSSHRRKRQKASFTSFLDNVPGIGPKRKAALLSHFNGLDSIKNASLDDLRKIIGTKAAEKLLASIKKDKQ